MDKEITNADFKKLITALKTIPSKTGKASYKSIRVIGNRVSLKRESSGEEVSISIEELYNVYKKESFINTTILRKYITGFVYSPALAILMATGLYDQNGNRNKDIDLDNFLSTKDETIQNTDNVFPKPTQIKTATNESDEQRFFRILAQVIGQEYLQAKGLNIPIDTELIELPCDYQKLSFKSKINQTLKTIAELLNSDFKFGNISLASKIDGLILDHPIVGTRIVEFDEEQHFTPLRLITLLKLQESIDIPYFSEYTHICRDMAYLNSTVIPKHRLKLSLSVIPTNIAEFREWLSQHAKTSGYIEAKNGFPYLGGRIAQRAYYDTLRDVAHLAEENNHLDAPLRFAKKTFENAFHRKYQNITDTELADGIRKRLWTCYDLKVN
jgi:hypothetical protein